jgi:hypothetical protein
MKHDVHLLTAALAMVRPCGGLATAIPVDTQRTECQSDKSYEPHCLMTWATQVAAMDEMVGASA